MAPRALGALFALVAAVCFATALAGGVVPKLVPSWWDGHPVVEGKAFERKVIYVGLRGAYGCNLGESVTCQELATGGKLDVIGIAELAALGFVSVTGVLLAFSIWKVGDRRKMIGKLVLIEVALVSAGGAVILLLGPDLKTAQHVDVPIGIGMYVFWSGVATAGLASLIAIRLEPEPLRLKTSLPQMAPQFDVRELVRENHDGLRPAMPPSPGGALPGPAGHLGTHQSSPPLFDNAPQLRPLYDVHNAVPAPVAPPLPTHGPTPMPRAAVGAQFGIPTPPPLEQVTPPTRPAPDVMAGLPDVGGLIVNNIGPKPQANNATIPTGSQPGNLTAMGSQPSRNAPPSTPPRSAPSPSSPPKLPGLPAPLGTRGKPSVPPPNRGAPAKHPTLPHAIPPPPTSANLPPPSVLSARDSNLDLRTPEGAATDRHEAMDPITGVEIDAEAKAAALALGDHTDRSAAAPPHTPPPALGDPTDQLKTVARDRVSQSSLDQTLARDRASQGSLDQTLARDRASAGSLDQTLARDRASASDLNQTLARERASMGDLNATTERQRESASALGPPPKRDSASAVGVATEHRQSPTAKPVEVPISTAPASLPPPKKAVAISSGPTPACPQCEAPMAWVEEHLRFYCASCRMYF